LEKEFVVLYNQPDNTYKLSKQVPGPILITNYNPDILCCEERAHLNDLARTWIANDVAFDIRPDYPGGEWPMRGAFRLRSFHAILGFLGRSIDEEPEYNVEKDPRTPAIIGDENPVATMELVVSDSLLRGDRPLDLLARPVIRGEYQGAAGPLEPGCFPVIIRLVPNNRH
jgi:hypothetical protein